MRNTRTLIFRCENMRNVGKKKNAGEQTSVNYGTVIRTFDLASLQCRDEEESRVVAAGPGRKYKQRSNIWWRSFQRLFLIRHYSWNYNGWYTLTVYMWVDDQYWWTWFSEQISILYPSVLALFLYNWQYYWNILRPLHSAVCHLGRGRGTSSWPYSSDCYDHAFLFSTHQPLRPAARGWNIPGLYTVYGPFKVK